MVPFQIVDPAIEIPQFFKFPFPFKFNYIPKGVIKILYLKIVTDRAGVNHRCTGMGNVLKSVLFRSSRWKVISRWRTKSGVFAGKFASSPALAQP